MYFSEKIEIIRKELELNQKDFATKIGLSQNAVSQYITGKRKPDYATIQKLIDLGVSPLFLFFNFNEPFDDELNVYIKDRKEKNETLTEIAEAIKELQQLQHDVEYIPVKE